MVAKVAYPEDGIFNNKFVTPAKAAIPISKELTKAGVKQDLKADQFQFVLKDRFGKVQVTVTKTVAEKENLLVAAVLPPLNMEFNNSFILLKPRTTLTSPTQPVTPKPAKPVVSSEKSGPQPSETDRANDTALLALGVAAVMGVAYSHRRRKDV
ncbi:LPXTG cell wall anchor domain-containing protein [Streptococcus vestibularis]|uniref:LPXTG cell wall anchor domain-containing protein n=1 Tax=Streptococcus vestibularis TaxID=1343 RepID=UPI003AB4F585